MATENYGRLKLLFVDDAPHTRTLLRELLRNTSWSQANVVESVAAALDAIWTRHPDLVFTDWQMPGESGLDLIRAIRNRGDSPDPLLPVILLTASGDAEHVMSARRAGATDFLVKPISLSRIVERVTNAVNRQRPFIVSATYTGPDWRRSGQQPDGDRAEQDALPEGGIVLPPDGLLLAKIRGEPGAIRDALQRRTEAIATVRRMRRSYAAAWTAQPNPSECTVPP